MEGEYKIPNTNSSKLLRKASSSSEKLLNRVTCRILSNINKSASLRTYVECLDVTGLVLVVSMIFFTCDELLLVLWVVVVFSVTRMEFRDKIVWHCSREEECWQGRIPGI